MIIGAMPNARFEKLMPRLATLLIWALLTASAGYWALGAGRVGTVQALPVVAAAPPTDSAAVARLLGFSRATDAKAAPVADKRYTLVGVLAQGRQGAALIALDGQPAKPYRVGSEVDAGLVLRYVGARSATLGAAGSADAAKDVTIELPALQQGGMRAGSASS